MSPEYLKLSTRRRWQVQFHTGWGWRIWGDIRVGISNRQSEIRVWSTEPYVTAININLVRIRVYKEGKIISEIVLLRERVSRRENDWDLGNSQEVGRERAKVSTWLLLPCAKATLLDDLCKYSPFPISFQLKSLFGIPFLTSSLIHTLFSFGLLSMPLESFSDTDLGRQDLLLYSNFPLSLRLKENLSFSYIVKAQVTGSSTGQSNNINAHYHFLKHVWILTDINSYLILPKTNKKSPPWTSTFWLYLLQTLNN